MDRAEAEAKFGPKIPDVVKAQGEKAVAAQAELAQGTIIAEAQPVVTLDTVKPPLAVVPTPPPETPPVVAPIPPQPTVEPLPGDWQSKYSVLQGKYNAEIPALQEAVSKANRTIEHLNGLLETLTRTVTPAAPLAPVAPGPAKEITAPAPLNLEDFEGYGDEVVAMAKMTAQNNQLLMDLTNKVGANEDRITATAEETFYNALDAAYPPQAEGQPVFWEVLNKDVGFIQWLQGLDDLSGEKRHDLLTKAFNALNAPQVLTFFRMYLQAAGVTPVAPSTTPAVTPVIVPTFTTPAVVEPLVPLPAAPVNPLATMVTVAPSVAGTPPGLTPAPVVTKEIFNKAVRDYTQGRIDEAEYTKIAGDFQQAIQQGHVT